MAERRRVIIDLITRTGGAKKGVTGLQKDLTTLNKGTVSAKSNLGGMSKSMTSAKRGLSSLSGGMGSAGLAAGAVGAGVLAVGGIIKGSVGAFASFDDAMNQSVAIMGNVSDAMRDDMSDAAREMAKTTRFSADEAAESYFFLASAGLDAEQSISALPAVAAFGQAGMFDMALATDLLTDAQSSLGLTVDDSAQNLTNMTRVSDVFVKANTLANTSVQQVSEAITNKLGASLRAYNIDLEEGVAVLAAYADQGLKGASAGESFNIVLRDLKKAASENKSAFAEANIEIFDSEGNFRNMSDIVGDLTGAFSGLSVEQQTYLAQQLGFQDRSFKNIQLLFGQADAIAEYEKELRKAGGTTEEVAGKQMESFSAQMDVVKAQIKDAGISLGQEMAPAFLAIGKGIGQAAEFIGPLIGGFFKLVGFLAEITGLATALEAIGAVLKLAGEGLGELEAMFDPAKKKSLELGKAIEHIGESLEKGTNPATALANGLAHLTRTGTVTADAIDEMTTAAGANQAEVEGALKANIDWAIANGMAADQIRIMKTALLDEIVASERSSAEKRELAFALGLVEQGASDLELAELGLVDSAEAMGGAAEDAEDEMVELEETTLSLADALAAAEENQTSLANAMREFADPTFAAISAIDKLKNAQAALADLQEEGEATAEELAEAQIEIAKAVLEAQGALDEFSAQGIDEQVGVLAAALDISDQAARDLLETLGLIDGKRVEARAVVVFDDPVNGKIAAAVFGAPTLTTGALARAHGGPVRKGEAYRVGERGEELFVPGMSGGIVPNKALISQPTSPEITRMIQLVAEGMNSLEQHNTFQVADPGTAAQLVSILSHTRSMVRGGLKGGAF